MAASPAGSTVYVATASGQLTVADAATGTVVARFTVGGLPDAVAVSPDGSRVYLAGAAGHLDVIDASTGKVIAAVTLGGVPDAVALSPGGSTVYVAGAAAKVLFVVDAATGQICAGWPRRDRGRDLLITRDVRPTA